MKLFAWIIGIVIVVVAALYSALFTSVGNSITGPIVENKIKEITKLDSRLSVFSLCMDKFEIVLDIDDYNNVYAKGDYSLFSKTFNIVYKIDFKNLETLKGFTDTPLKGVLNADGIAVGDIDFIKIDGKSGVAFSDTTYHVELTELNPTSIIAKIKDADLVALLELGGQKPYAKAKLDIDVNFKNITPGKLDGGVVVNTKNGKINTPLMNQDFNLTIPNTEFSMSLDAKLKGDDIDYIYALNSNLVNVISNGKVTPTPLKTDIKYKVDVQELAVLQPITKADVRGPIRVDGTLSGTKESMVVDGKSDLAGSDTIFTATLKDFEPVSLKAKMKNLELSKLLYMIRQPHYADGLFSLDADIKDIKVGSLKGDVVTTIRNGLVDSKFLTKEYRFKTAMPRTTFALATKSKLDRDIVDTGVTLKSTLVNLDIKQARLNLSESSLTSDYIATIPDLERLYFVSERHLKGSLSANGEFKKAKNLDFTIHSDVAGGILDAKLHNDDFHADIKSVQTLKVLEMLIYPQMFSSSLNGVLDYNLANQKGKFVGDLVDGYFTQNQMLTLVKQYGRVDLYKEKFKGAVSADINKENILASLDLSSNTSSISTKDTKLNSKTKNIDSKIEIVANKNPITVYLSGAATSPKVKINAKKLLEQKAKEKIKEKLNEKVGNLLKGLF